MSTTLHASVVPIFQNANLVTPMDGGNPQTTPEVTALLAINPASAPTFDVSLGKILQNGRTVSESDRRLFAPGILAPSSPGPDEAGSTNASGILEFADNDFTRAFGADQQNMSNISVAEDLAALGAARVVDLWRTGATVAWDAGDVLPASGPGISTASAYAIDGGSSTSGSEILAGTGSTMTKTPVEPDAVTATKTWDAGAGAGNWGGANNWNSNGVPGSGDDVRFDNTGQSPLEDIFLNGNRSINSLTIDLTAGSNQNWNLGADDNNNAYTLTLATGNISVLSTSGTGTYIIGATSGNNIGTGIMTLATSGTGFTFNNSRTNGGLLQINAIISGSSKTVTKTGAGTVILSHANTFTGATTVSGGTLSLANSSGSSLGFTSGITVNTGAILYLGGNNQINNTAQIILAGGRFTRGGFSEGGLGSAGVGTLSLTAAGSRVDFGTGTVGILTFANFAPGAFTLTIDNWSGTAATQGTPGLSDRLIFAASQSGNLGSFNFTGFAAGAVQFDLGNGYFEITPVPETGTYLSGSIVLALILLHHRRQPGRLVHRSRASRKPRFSAAHGTGVAS